MNDTAVQAEPCIVAPKSNNYRGQWGEEPPDSVKRCYFLVVGGCRLWPCFMVYLKYGCNLKHTVVRRMDFSFKNEEEPLTLCGIIIFPGFLSHMSVSGWVEADCCENNLCVYSALCWVTVRTWLRDMIQQRGLRFRLYRLIGINSDNYQCKQRSFHSCQCKAGLLLTLTDEVVFRDRHNGRHLRRDKDHSGTNCLVIVTGPQKMVACQCVIMFSVSS